MERIKTIRTRDGYTIDLWRDERAFDRMRTCYAATVRTRGFTDQAERRQS